MATKISTKIKILGALLVLLILAVISVTVHLNDKNEKDALIVNIVGKERMLTQKMTKSIFYNYGAEIKDFNELNDASVEFVKNLYSLKNGDTTRRISSAPTEFINLQLDNVIDLWASFKTDIESFKKYSISKEPDAIAKTKLAFENIHNKNNTLLFEVDKLVTLYTAHYEYKTTQIKTFQYLAGFVLFVLMTYSLLVLRNIEQHANEFFEKSKELAQTSFDSPIQPIQIKAEDEINEATDTINCFIDKLNSAVSYSRDALKFSKNASLKLEEITDELEDIIKEINDKEIKRVLNKSEDIAIESAEDLLNSSKKLEGLKNQLDLLLQACKNSKPN